MIKRKIGAGEETEETAGRFWIANVGSRGDEHGGERLGTPDKNNSTLLSASSEYLTKSPEKQNLASSVLIWVY